MSIKKLLRKNLEWLANKSLSEYYLHHNKVDVPKFELDYKQARFHVFEDPENHWRNFIVEPYKVHGGRTMQFVVWDSVTKQFLGAILLKNDTVNLKARDEFIGWKDRERLKFTVRATYFSPDPKLIPLFSWISLTLPVQLPWNATYKNQHVVGVTTTSLQQKELKYWTYCGEYTERTQVEPSKQVWDQVVKWIETKYPTKKPEQAYDILGIKRPYIKTKRYVHFCDLYKDAIPFLRKEKLKIVAQPALDQRMDIIIKEWKDGLC